MRLRDRWARRDQDEIETDPVESASARPEGVGGVSVRTISLIVGVIYLVGSLIIFRSVLFAIPSVMRGDAVIGGDELVPFWNWHTQLLDQAAGSFNDLVNGYEFRVRYTFLATWLRYYKVLPFAILIVIPGMFWVAYLTVTRFMDKVFTSLSSQAIYLATFFPVTLIYLIMVYAKIAHFYELILGLMLMTISSMWMLYAVLFAGRRWKRYMVIAAFATLFNPAIHYLILFSLFFALTAVILLVGEIGHWVRTGGKMRARELPHRIRTLVGEAGRRSRLRAWFVRFQTTTTGRVIVGFVMYGLITLIPYALFVKYVALAGVTNLTDTVPGDYYFINDASVSWLHMLSWDLAGITDKLLYGDYLSKIPRVPDMAYTVLLFVPLVIPAVRRRLFSTRSHRQLLGVLYGIIAFAMWATIGYGEPKWLPTFHRTLAALAITANNSHSTIGNLVVTLAGTVVQILRFPHRFQLILFMLAPLVMSLTLAYLVDSVSGRFLRTGAALTPSRASVLLGRFTSAARTEATTTRRTERATKRRVRAARRPNSGRPGRWVSRAQSPLVMKLLATACIGAVFFTPFWSNNPYRQVFSDGNMAGFLSPFPVQDLKAVKNALNALPSGKTVVIPPTETAKLVQDTNGVDHKFIDKFFIYYLDKPSYYYGLTGDVKNKFEFFLILRGLYYKQDWWINEARNISIKYIVVNRKIHSNNGVGAEYLPDVQNYVEPMLKRLPDQIALRYENDSYALYEITDQPKVNRPVLLVDSSWQSYLNLVFPRRDLSRCYDIQYMTYFDPKSVPAGSPVQLLGDDVGTAALDLWLLNHPEAISGPDSRMFAFNPDVVASNYYLSPMFRSFLLFSNTKWNRMNMITPGVFGTLRGSFIGLPRATQISVPVKIATAGKYHVFMRTADTANSLHITAPTLKYDKTLELRSPAADLKLYNTADVFNTDRKPVDTSKMSVADLEAAIPDQLVPINSSFAYQDLGVVDAKAGSATFSITKSDTNPMLFEGMMLVPESEYEGLTLPAGVTKITDPNTLECSEHTTSASASDGYVDPAANPEHANLTQDQLLALAAADIADMAPPTDAVLSSSWFGVALTVLLLLGSALLVRWRARSHPDDPEPDPQPDPEDPAPDPDDPDPPPQTPPKEHGP